MSWASRVMGPRAGPRSRPPAPPRVAASGRAPPRAAASRRLGGARCRAPAASVLNSQLDAPAPTALPDRRRLPEELPVRRSARRVIAVAPADPAARGWRRADSRADARATSKPAAPSRSDSSATSRSRSPSRRRTTTSTIVADREYPSYHDLAESTAHRDGRTRDRLERGLESYERKLTHDQRRGPRHCRGRARAGTRPPRARAAARLGSGRWAWRRSRRGR